MHSVSICFALTVVAVAMLSPEVRLLTGPEGRKSSEIAPPVHQDRKALDNISRPDGRATRRFCTSRSAVSVPEGLLFRN
jgi:hypothetical protein